MCTRASESGTRASGIGSCASKMVDVLTKSYLPGAKSYARCDLIERIGREQQSEDMPTPLSAFYRQRIVSLWTQGHSITSIVRALGTEGRETTRTTVRKWIFRWEKQGGLEDKARCGRPSKITCEIADYLNEQLEDDGELSSVELHVCAHTPQTPLQNQSSHYHLLTLHPHWTDGSWGYSSDCEGCSCDCEGYSWDDVSCSLVDVGDMSNA